MNWPKEKLFILGDKIAKSEGAIFVPCSLPQDFYLFIYLIFYPWFICLGDFLWAPHSFWTVHVCFSLAEEKKRSNLFLSQVFNINIFTVWPHIECPFPPLSDWPANRMCADTWPVVTLLTPLTVNTDRPHAVSPSGRGVLISRVAPNPSWLLSDIRSIRPGKVDTRNVENVIGQKQPCRKSLSPVPFIFNQSSWLWDGWKHKKCMANSLWASPGLSHSN